MLVYYANICSTRKHFLDNVQEKHDGELAYYIHGDGDMMINIFLKRQNKRRQ